MNSKLAKSTQPIVKTSCCTLYTSRTALFSEAGVHGEKELPNQPNYDGRPHVYANRFSARHGGRGNIVFFDCHTEPFRAAQLVTPSGQAPFPQQPIQWTSNPDADANLSQ
jgi:prepilin-type processing-associated H-X9-DG protein